MREAIVETRGVDTPYQTLVKFSDSGPRIHIFWRGDGDPDCHDHPADFWTFPLVSYVEEVVNYDAWRTEQRIVRAFRLHRRGAELAHRVLGSFEGFAGGRPAVGHRAIVSLVWWGKKRREWGFHTPAGWVPWRQYIGESAA